MAPPLDDEYDDAEGFEPDEWDDDVSPEEQLARWADQMGQWLPPDFIQPLATWPDPSQIRGDPFTSPSAAAEYLFGTGAFPFSVILYDELADLYYLAVGESV